jgi:biotin transporter BioY
MILFARTIAFIIGAFLIGLITYLSFFVLDTSITYKILIYLLFVYFSIVIAAICGDQILRRLKNQRSKKEHGPYGP